ncbi:unnamed protein product [Boreogadus saida]
MWSLHDEDRMHLQADPLPQRSPRRAQQGEALRAVATAAAGNRGNLGGGTRHPLSVLSGNTSHRNGPTHRGGGNDKPSSRGPAPPPPCCHDDQEEPWSVVRPGYVREKIAIFASSLPPSPPPPPPPPGAEDPEEAFGSTGGGGLKVKGGWERESRSAKRRRRRSGGRGLAAAAAAGGGGAEPEEAVSVGEIVASLEQQMTSVPSLLALQRSSSSLTASRTPPGEEAPGGGGEAVRVWDLVARLESGGPSGPGRRLLRGPPSAPPTPAPGSGSEAQLEVQRPRGPPTTTTDPQTLRCGEEGEVEEEGEGEARFQLQLLLEPPRLPALLRLPPPLLLHVLSLLPTRSLAALRCSCRHFAPLMDAYGVRAADSGWAGDPRYRDDPCKQCKRRYRRGDVSLCRWHHKPYCPAPYGLTGYWMCCYGARKDAPGCNVGLHDNRWVPDFHSFPSALYVRRRGGESADEA